MPVKDNLAWSTSRLKGTAARELQKAIRMECADENGICECVTCGTCNHYKLMHAGHFVPSRCNAVLFDERGIHPQCVRCNTYLGGNQSAYARWMNENYGPEIVEELLAARLQTKKFTRDELVEMRNLFRERIKAQQLRLEGL
jgi:hypothetical protein